VAAVRRLIVSSLLVCLSALLAFAALAGASLVGFQSEDHKVGCYLNGKGARCDVKNPKWDAPPKPATCELDWGQGVSIDRKGRADYVCAGDTTLDPSHQVLFAGDKVKRGRFKCKARDAATIKCVNTRNKHGFVVSREEVDVF
jgi:hypothetical protein